MTTQPHVIFISDTPQKQVAKAVSGEYVPLLGDQFYKIHNFDAMEPFFMSIVSSSDHWLFIASTGGLTAGRGSAEQAIFPYYTVDKLTENSENTGSKAILLAKRGQRTFLWEPFSDRQRGSYTIERNLYKNIAGTAVVFEEINHDLGLVYRYAWRTGDKYGFIKTTWLENTRDTLCQVDLLDGLQNLLPANVSSGTQNTFGSLLDAYKRSELDPAAGLGIFMLNSRLSDMPEPSESLQATTVAYVGLVPAGYLLSSRQLDRFRAGEGIQTEMEVRGQRCAYFIRAVIDLAPAATRSWHLFTDVMQDASAVARTLRRLHDDPDLAGSLEKDIAANRRKLWEIVASADGLQQSNIELFSAHHFANVMFNVMRGGIFVDQYWIQSKDLAEFVSMRSRSLFQAQRDFFAGLPEKIHVSDLQARAEAAGSPDLIRLCSAYLPLIFSRRHGDPSRPWNRFAINLKRPDGSVKIDYEGNWRDIFQNWEALAYSYPEFVESMISTFLNATTVDGYNPYRITHHGIDWELPDPHDPWSNIGYWSDHQIIYLQKLMEISVKMHPGKLHDYLARPIFCYSNVPYRIKPYAALLQDPFHTIDLDWDMQRLIQERVKEHGVDGKCVFDPRGQVLKTTLAEKLLTLLLAKLSNFVPEGGIWMNTQRPEWNDANNALVAKGLSVVTLCYLRLYVAFCKDLFHQSGLATVPLGSEVQQFAAQVSAIFQQYHPILRGTFTDEQRRSMMDALGQAGSDYRWNFYQNGLCGERIDHPVAEIVAFLGLAQEFIEHSLWANKRSDHLYHAYNVLHLASQRASIGYLYEMLEGQTSILASGLLNGEESLALLQALRKSALYQEGQNSYILYPDRHLKSFLEKNSLPADRVSKISLFARLAEAGDTTLVTRDLGGVYHFAGPIRSFRDVDQALNILRGDTRYTALIEAEYQQIKDLFEDIFHHNEFTGRSGTFFAYEGLGSIYWHMVAKLLLAAQEAAQRFRGEEQAGALMERYTDIRQGLGYNKPVEVYGAFPSDPYSHTPKGQGAKQPGMTGLVKEEILVRQAELGYTVADGRIVFDLLLLDRQELLTRPESFTYVDVNNQEQQTSLPAGSMAYTICQVPVVLQEGGGPAITVQYTDGTSQTIAGSRLDEANSRHIFLRDGTVKALTVRFP